MVAIDEAFFLKHTDVVLPIVKVRGRALIVMSSTTSDVEVEGNPLPREALHEPTSCRGVTFHFPCMVAMPMDFFGGTTPHLHRKYSA